MVTQIIIDAKAPCLNAAYATDFKTKMRFKTKVARDFETIVRGATISKSLTVEDDEYILASYTFYTSTLITAKGKINKNKGDWEARIKVLQDYLFQFLKLDDCLICTGFVKQLYYKKDLVVVDLETRPISELYVTGEPY